MRAVIATRDHCKGVAVVFGKLNPKAQSVAIRMGRLALEAEPVRNLKLQVMEEIDRAGRLK